MPQRRKIPEERQHEVRKRAKFLCEYCHTSELWQYVRFTVDHILPISRGGTNASDNLCLACFHCNRRKSDAISAIDPLTGELYPLFHPRHDRWNDRFI